MINRKNKQRSEKAIFTSKITSILVTFILSILFIILFTPLSQATIAGNASVDVQNIVSDATNVNFTVTINNPSDATTNYTWTKIEVPNGFVIDDNNGTNIGPSGWVVANLFEDRIEFNTSGTGISNGTSDQFIIRMLSINNVAVDKSNNVWDIEVSEDSSGTTGRVGQTESSPGVLNTTQRVLGIESFSITTPQGAIDNTVNQNQTVEIVLVVKNHGSSSLIVTPSLSSDKPGDSIGPIPLTAGIGASSSYNFTYSSFSFSSTTGNHILIADASASGADAISDINNLTGQLAVTVQTPTQMRVDDGVVETQAKVSQGQSFEVKVKVINDGEATGNITPNFSDLEFISNGIDVSSEYNVSAPNSTTIIGGKEGAIKLTYTVLASSTATTGNVTIATTSNQPTVTDTNIDSTASYTNNGTINMTVQTPASLTMETNIDTDILLQGHKNVKITVTINNSGEAKATITPTLIFTHENDTVTSNFTIDPSSSNPSFVNGLTQEILNFTINVSDSAVTGDIKLNVSISDIDVNSKKDVSVSDTVDIKIIGDVLGSFIDQVAFTKDNVTTINTGGINIILEILTNETIEAYLNLAEKAENPVSVDASGIGFRYMLIDAESSLDDALTWAVIKLYYNDSSVIARNIEESTLKIHVYNTSAAQWQLLDDTNVDTSENFVWGNVSQFSLYGAYGNPIPTSPSLPQPSGGGGCVYDWKCTEWSACSENGQQTRTCTSKSVCLGNFRKPDEIRECTYISTEVEEELEAEEPEEVEETSQLTAGLAFITGAVIGTAGGKIGVASFIIILIVLGLFIIFSKFYGRMPGAKFIKNKFRSWRKRRS